MRAAVQALVKQIMAAAGSTKPANSGVYGDVFVVPLNGKEPRLCKTFPGACHMCRQFPPPPGKMLVKVQRYRGKRNRHKTAQAEFQIHRQLAMPGKCATLPTAGKLCTAPLVPRIYAGIDSGEQFVTFMEYIDGETLYAVLRRQGGKLSPTQFAAIQTAVLTLWANGYSHNDLHDKNIMFGKDGTIRVIDLGLSFGYAPAATHPRDARFTSKYARDLTSMADTLLTRWQLGKPPKPASTANMRMLRLYAAMVHPDAARATAATGTA